MIDLDNQSIIRSVDGERKGKNAYIKERPLTEVKGHLGDDQNVYPLSPLIKV